MATQQDYTVAADAIMAVIQSDINDLVPGWAQGMIPAGTAAAMAGACAKAGVDALDAYRAQEAAPQPAAPADQAQS